VEILGLVFAGSATDRRAAMTRFVESTLGLRRAPGTEPVDGEPGFSDMFELPDGSRFAVADERTVGGGTSRTIGFLVADLRAAVAELTAAGVAVDEPAESDTQRYAHFIAPDGGLYELVEQL
jgi:catechol 2,3-dioxygenase-like lactoylglutathione lyase family enzyme